MKNLTKPTAAGSCLLIIGLFFLIPVAGSQEATVIKIATLAPDGSSWIRTLNAVNDEISKKTDNRVRFKIYPGGILGDEGDMLRKIYIGQIQGAVLTSSGLSTIFQEMDVFQIPFLFEKYQEVDYVIDKMDAFFKNGFAGKGYIMLGWSEGGFVRLMSTIPVDTLEKLKKARVWTWPGSPMTKAIFDEAGVAGIPLSVPDVLVGLQTGLVDVVYAPPSGAIAMQWFTKTKYCTDVPLIYLVGGLMLKKSVFSKIPPNYQNAMRESFQQHMNQLKNVIRKENQEALQVMAKHGVKILKPSQDQIDEFKALSNKAMNRLGEKSFSQEVRKEVEGHLKAYRGEKIQ